MSMLDVARFLSYSRSVDLTPEKGRYFNLSMVNTNHLFSCLNGRSRYWNYGRDSLEQVGQMSDCGKES